MADAMQDLRPRRGGAFWALLLGAALSFAGFVALGVWQLERLAWKRDLIARVDQRLAAAPVRAPDASRWAAVNKADDEYRRVELIGRFDHSRETLVGASTELGTGYWVLTPLRTTQGDWVLVNRGFVPPEFQTRVSRTASEAQGDVDVVGLLRLTEPGGRVLRENVPAENRWYSRDVAAIAKARAIVEGPVAPYFVDASAADDKTAWPRGGLTVVRFNDHHLQYALTWFAMAAMTAGIAVYLWRVERRRGRD
ncbi:Surfeit locus 1 family protein [Roseateles aquatilis]|uniref:SURF1-like protein n=1 Tax=Roseateles aquatilis TaxID=431061 RepID=A0A246JMF8_9BURK|nr:SURF1 family protein [Roseateles aquatilis]OWQ93792.1 Surfeit locus 1 family protein [Roseateles aquatilis]